VEGLVGYARRNFMVPIPRASSWEELNLHLEADCRKRRERRLRGHTETIGERFERDRTALLPLPAAPYEACEKISARVSSLSLVRYRSNDYSVPTEYGHRQVWVKGYVHEVVIACSSEVIARHQRSYERETVIFDPLHYLALLEQKTRALDQAAPLTGFDVPCLHTMYVEKYMHAHGLMQAIARVNRVFRDKRGGLVVDYLGIAQELKKALSTYTEGGGEGDLTRPQHEAVELMLRRHQECCALFEGFDWSGWASAKPSEKLGMLPWAQEHILAQPQGKESLSRSVVELTHAFALAVPHDEGLRIRDDVGFFQAVKAVLAKSPTQQASRVDADLAIRQIVSNAIVSEDVVDIFAAAGLKKPDISILSDEFLAEIQAMPQRNLAVELLQKLLKGEIKTRSRRNVVQARKFSELIEASLRRYRNRAIETAQVIEELIELAKSLNGALRRGERLGLSEDELAFYDALEVNDSAVRVFGDVCLRTIAKELVENVHKNASIDWPQRESVQAKLRVIVKRILKTFGYPPDKQEKATQTVLEQAEVLSEGWAVSN